MHALRLANSLAHRRSVEHKPRLAALASLSFSILGGMALALAWLLSAHASPQSAPPAAPALPPPANLTPGLRLLASDDDGVTIELTLPEPAFQTRQLDGHDCLDIETPGFVAYGLPGWPALPVGGALIGIPPLGEPALTVLSAEAFTISLSADLCPAAAPRFESGLNGELVYLGEAAIPNPAGYATRQAVPPAEIAATGFIRSQRVAQLRFRPAAYDPLSQRLRLYRRLVVRVAFAAQGGAWLDEGDFETLYRATLLNYAQARAWRTPPAVASRPLPEITSPAYKLGVNSDGLYRLTYADLQAAGVDVDNLDPRTLHVSVGGQEVAIQVVGETDGRFDPGDALLFYGQKVNTRYTDTNIYWLTWGGAAGRRMPSLDGTPGASTPLLASFETSLHLEHDHIYQSSRPSGPQNDRWYWDYVYAAGSPAFKDFSFTITNLFTGSYSATVSGLLRGYAATPQHHTRLYLNGHLFDDALWPADAAYSFTVSVPHHYLQPGQNILRLECPLDGGITLDVPMINWFEIGHRQVYTTSSDWLVFDGDLPGTWKYQLRGFTTSTVAILDVTDPLTPRRIENAAVQAGVGYTLTFGHVITAEHHYLAAAIAESLQPAQMVLDTSSSLSSGDNGADYLMITHHDFYTDILPLANWRAAQGLRVQVVDVQDIYDEFSAGVFDAQAIRDFLAYAYAHWQAPAPTYVLLVGDGNYDFKNGLGFGDVTYLPPYLADVDPWLGETAADNRYVCVSGDDNLPDMHIGRLPVRTSAEAAAMVAKIISYEQAANQPWNQQLLFVADNADSGGDFAASAESVIARFVRPPYAAQKIYYGITHTTPAATRAAIVAAINQGQLLVNYFGHASVQWWAAEQLFRRADISSLDNADKLPVVAAMSCLEGYFINPSLPGGDASSLGESLARAAAKGAVATWSPSGMAVATGHDYLDSGLLQAIFLDDVTEIGAATTQAKYALFSGTSYFRDLLDTYVLFGDPATRLKTLPAELGLSLSVTPVGALITGETLTYTLVFSNSGAATAHHVTIEQQLEGGLLDWGFVSAGAVVTPLGGSHPAWQVVDLPAGEGGIIILTATVGPQLVRPFTSTAVIASSAWETNPANNFAGPVTTTVILPDLALVKTGPPRVNTAALITYTLHYTNVGLAPARQVIITDLLPAALLSPTFTADPAVVARPGSPFVWEAGPLAAGQSGVITLSARLEPQATGVLTNAAVAAGVVETNTLNNLAAPVTTVILNPDLAIFKAGPHQAMPGDWITYTLTFTNLGPMLAAGVTISDALPGVLLTPTFTSSGAALAPVPGAVFAWRVGELLPGAGGVITVSARIPPDFAGVLANRAVITGLLAETNLANNAAGPLTTGVAAPELVIFKDGPPLAQAGHWLTYTLTFANQGNGAATGVVISDTLPAGLFTPTVTSSGAAITLAW